MYADKEALGIDNGRPILSDNGMEAIHDLLDAHEAYDKLSGLHHEGVSLLSQQILDLTAQRDALLHDRELKVHEQHVARDRGRCALEHSVDSDTKGNNPVYAAVIRSVASDGQHGLWNPDTLRVADSTGRSLVRLDKAIRGNVTSVPIMVINEEIRSRYVNVYVAKSKRLNGLSVSTIEERKHYLGRGESVSDRIALELPIRHRTITSYQFHPRQNGPLRNFMKDKPGIRRTEDAFKLVLPQGKQFNEDDYLLGTYDVNNRSEGVYGRLGQIEPESHYDGRTFFAIGKDSVAKAIEALEQQFIEQAEEDVHGELFNRLSQVVLGYSLEYQHTAT